MGHADMDDFLDTGTLSTSKERLGILHRPFKSRIPVFETDPIGVIESSCATKVFGEQGRRIEMERESPNRGAKWILLIGMCGNGSYLTTGIEQTTSDVLPDVPEGTGDHIRFAPQCWLSPGRQTTPRSNSADSRPSPPSPNPAWSSGIDRSCAAIP